MKTIKFIAIILLFTGLFITGCTKQPYYDVPTDPSGNVVITDIATAQTDGISLLDDHFTVVATLPNAKSGDVMKVELLKLQPMGTSGSNQLLPLAGTQKDVTVGADLKATITYTRAEAKLENVGDYVTVTFAGKTESAIKRIDMVSAAALSGPKYNGNEVALTRGAGTAYLDFDVHPKNGTYEGEVTVKRKNGANDAWVTVGNYAAPAKIPISGTDFSTGKDTMFYSFVAAQDSYTEEINTQIVISEPAFFAKRTGSLVLAAKGGVNPISGTAVTADDANAMLAVSGSSLAIKGGAQWETGGKSVTFVPSTPELYSKDNAKETMDAFNAGAPVSSADPAAGTGVYIFKLVNGPAAADTWYGIMKVVKVVPGASLDIEYRIGYTYEQLSQME
ncbi:hypothetical protein [Chitinophaga sp. MM2321]|uniref:hypothetical protein n=1 Tax=Chitinophaga sp. MM2321 TaxID=3137178 RepID=UPI0032D593D7